MMRNFKNLALISSITLVALMGIFTVYNIDAATRDENIQKINGFLSNEKVIEGLQKRGTSPDTISKSLDSFSDSQIENLANHANLQVGGRIDDSGTSDFWKTWGTIFLIYMGVLVTLVIIIVAV
jgi:hypothetical protein